jgi:hypothetical protein
VLSHLFKTLQSNEISPIVKSFGIFFEVEGSMDQFCSISQKQFLKSGVTRLAINAPEARFRPGEAMRTVRFPMRLHWDKSIDEIRHLLAAFVLEAFERLFKACRKKGYEIQEAELMDAVRTVLATFLADQGEYPPGPADFEIAARLQALEDVRRLADALGEPEPDLREFLRVQERLEREAKKGGG